MVNLFVQPSIGPYVVNFTAHFDKNGLNMKKCERCLRNFNNNENLDNSPARELGDIFISDIADVNVKNICPECREELGVMNLMGFKP
jgi:hypothetical protein